MRLDRQLLQRLLDTWKKIKDIRRSNGYITTSVRLIIKQFVLFDYLIIYRKFLNRMSGKKTRHYEQMQQQIEEEIEDEIALADEQYKREEVVYKNLIHKRKVQASGKVYFIFNIFLI
jgi:hypothetical protein